MTVREYPSEGAEDRLPAPAVGTTPARDRAHLLDEPADDREQQVQRERPHDGTSHDASVGLHAHRLPVLVRPEEASVLAMRSSLEPSSRSSVPVPTVSRAMWLSTRSRWASLAPAVRTRDGSASLCRSGQGDRQRGQVVEAGHGDRQWRLRWSQRPELDGVERVEEDKPSSVGRGGEVGRCARASEGASTAPVASPQVGNAPGHPATTRSSGTATSVASTCRR